MTYKVILRGINRLTNEKTLKTIAIPGQKPKSVGFIIHKWKLAGFVEFDSFQVAWAVARAYNGSIIDGNVILTCVQ